MPQTRRRWFWLALGVALYAAPGFAAPLFTLSEDGAYFLYRARPGDHPGVVAETFGIPSEAVPRFLAANGITDPTRVGAGFVYRIPNPVAERADALAADNGRLTRAAADAEARATTAARDAERARADAAQAEARAERLAGYELRWTVARTVILLLGFALAGAIAIAAASVRRQHQSTRWARALDRELEEKRRSGLGERQESARRILELETRVRDLETKLGPRVLIGGRSA
jgi:hypothetical protein